MMNELIERLTEESNTTISNGFKFWVDAMWNEECTYFSYTMAKGYINGVFACGRISYKLYDALVSELKILYSFLD